MPTDFLPSDAGFAEARDHFFPRQMKGNLRRPPTAIDELRRDCRVRNEEIASVQFAGAVLLDNGTFSLFLENEKEMFTRIGPDHLSVANHAMRVQRNRHSLETGNQPSLDRPPNLVPFVQPGIYAKASANLAKKARVIVDVVITPFGRKDPIHAAPMGSLHAVFG